MTGFANLHLWQFDLSLPMWCHSVARNVEEIEKIIIINKNTTLSVLSRASMWAG